jgi:hypothetical protein
MKKLTLLVVIVFALLFASAPAWAGSLEWTDPYPEDNIGATFYFSDGAAHWNYSILRAAMVQSGNLFAFLNFEEALNLPYGVEVSIYMTVHDGHSESEPSNTITYIRTGTAPPANKLPDPPKKPSPGQGLKVGQK